MASSFFPPPAAGAAAAAAGAAPPAAGAAATETLVAFCYQCFDVLSRKFGNNLLESSVVNLGINGTKDLLNVSSGGAGLSSENKQQVSGYVLHYTRGRLSFCCEFTSETFFYWARKPNFPGTAAGPIQFILKRHLRGYEKWCFLCWRFVAWPVLPTTSGFGSTMMPIGFIPMVRLAICTTFTSTSKCHY